MRTEFEVLTENLEYDHWANAQWLSYLEQKGKPAEEWAVLHHMLVAHEAWLMHANGTSLAGLPNPEVSLATLSDFGERWDALLDRMADNPLITYRLRSGKQFMHRLSQMAAHIIDHGSYHRGQIRAMVGARGWEDFPETGIFSFYLATGDSPS